MLSTAVIEKVDEYIAHREERERQIVDYLQTAGACSSGNTSGRHLPSASACQSRWRSSWEIMSAIYPSTLPVIIKVSAQHNVQHHLSKLEMDGEVTSAWPDLWCYTKDKKYI